MKAPAGPAVDVAGDRPSARRLVDMFMTAFDGARRFARNVRYLFPLFYDPAQGIPVDSGTNYSVAGLYAYGALLAHRFSGCSEFLDEAREALLTLARLPLGLLYHEPQQFAFGALAAAEIAALPRGCDDHDAERIARLAEDLVRAQLRMVYWYDDAARSMGAYHTLGLFQACASILYPAFKENVEAVLPWLPLLKRGGFHPALPRVLGLQRVNNFYYFDPALPEAQRTGAPCPHIPYENLAMLELPDSTGYVGKEIYGAGEVFWLYMMFEAFARASDPAVTTVFLDLLDWEHPFMDEAVPRSVLVHNPGYARFAGTVDLLLPSFKGSCRTTLFRLGRGGAWEPSLAGHSRAGAIEVSLAPDECCKLVIEPACG